MLINGVLTQSSERKPALYLILLSRAGDGIMGRGEADRPLLLVSTPFEKKGVRERRRQVNSRNVHALNRIESSARLWC